MSNFQRFADEHIYISLPLGQTLSSRLIKMKPHCHNIEYVKVVYHASHTLLNRMSGMETRLVYRTTVRTRSIVEQQTLGPHSTSDRELDVA